MEAQARIRQILIGVHARLGTDDRVEALAVAFEDRQIDDVISHRAATTALGRRWTPLSAAASRLETLLTATAHALVPGLQTGGAIDGWDDTGFRAEYRDPHPSSRNQVGHFLTAVGLGYRPGSVRQSLAAAAQRTSGVLGGLASLWRRDPLLGRLGLSDALQEREWLPPFAILHRLSDDEVAIRLIVGHEKVADPRVDVRAFRHQFAAATSADVEVFRRAETTLGTTLPLNTTAAGNTLRGITVDSTLRGNSYEDLVLSLVGWRLGKDIAAERLVSRALVATWLRSTLA